MESNPVTNQVGATILFYKQMGAIDSPFSGCIFNIFCIFYFGDVDWISREEFIRLL